MRFWCVLCALVFPILFADCKASKADPDPESDETGGGVPDCDTSSPPYLDIPNGCDYDFTTDGSPLVTGSCSTAFASSGNSDSQAGLQRSSESGVTPYEYFSVTLQADGTWEDLEGYDSESATTDLLAILDFTRAAEMPTLGTIAELSQIDGYINVASTSCYAGTGAGTTDTADPLTLRVLSTEAICFDTLSNRTFYEVHGTISGECSVTLGGVPDMQPVAVELTF